MPASPAARARGEVYYNLGLSCANGLANQVQDWTRAVYFFRLAAEQGNAAAQTYLGTCYEGGLGVEVDAVEAVRYFRLAAEQGSLNALYGLGACCANRESVVYDMVEALRCFRRAGAKGHNAALYALGTCYARGQGVAEDAAEAVRYYRQAAEQGSLAAQYQLGDCLEHGNGVAQDLAEAVRYYRLATPAAQTGELTPEVLDEITAAFERIACDREVAAACCLGCGARHKLKKCSKCLVARFCGAECAQRAWSAHKPNCKLWRDE